MRKLAGKRVLVTGVTGFLGQAVFERLLLEFPDTRVSLLVRPQLGSTGRQRVESLMGRPVFNALREKVGADGVTAVLSERVDVIDGDFTQDDLEVPSDVDVAASFLDTSSSQLRRLLHRAFPLQRGRAVEHLLEWLRVLSASDPARSSKKQRVVAEAMSRTDRALRSTCRRLTGRTMRELRDDPEYLIHLAFDRLGL